MKKIVKYLLVLSLSLVCLIGNATSTYAANASLTGPSTVRGGDTITLNLRVSDDGKYGLEGVLEYNSAQVSLVSATTSLSGWKVESNGNTIIAYDDNLNNSLSGTQTVVSLTFKVADGLATGTKVEISVNNLVTTDGSNEGQLGKATYAITIVRPLSDNANLSALSVSGATLSPAFASGTTSYDLGEVDYSVSKLNVSYTAEDANATVSVKGNSLSVGKNTVSVIVTAENGTTKTYKLTVTRAQDPNYIASSNASLKSMSVSLGMVSPAFSEDVTDYIVYLPFECVGEKLTVSGKAADSKAQGVVEGVIDKLVEGENHTSLICKAEDGTEKTYTITVFVMPEYTGEIPSIGGSGEGEGNPVDEPTEMPTEEPTETTTEDTQTTETQTEDDSTQNMPAQDENNGPSGVVTLLVVLVVIGLIGALVYVLFFSNKKF